MLPDPVSTPARSNRPHTVRRKFSRSGDYYYLNGDGQIPIWRRLRERARITNLAVILLSITLVYSLIVNIKHSFFKPESFKVAGVGEGHVWDESRESTTVASTETEGSIEESLARPTGLQSLEHLVMVPGHGVWFGSHPEDIFNDSFWALETYQLGTGAHSRINAFVSHIQRAVEIADTDPQSLLIFSGASTKEVTPISEGASYYSLAVTLGLLPSAPISSAETAHRDLPLRSRSTTEDYALDSFQNLLFSIARFRLVTGHYPKRITVVGYGLKRRRFTELHAQALRWPLTSGSWRYVGIDMDDEVEREVALEGEVLNGYGPYLEDLYGCHGTLARKRKSRNIHLQVHPYLLAAPEIASLLRWCPSPDISSPVDEYQKDSNVGEDYNHLFPGSLPWASS